MFTFSWDEESLRKGSSFCHASERDWLMQGWWMMIVTPFSDLSGMIFIMLPDVLSGRPASSPGCPPPPGVTWTGSPPPRATSPWPPAPPRRTSPGRDTPSTLTDKTLHSTGTMRRWPRRSRPGGSSSRAWRAVCPSALSGEVLELSDPHRELSPGRMKLWRRVARKPPGAETG